MTWERDVYSSNVAKVGYDAEAKELFVTWIKGKTSIYSGVPEDTALECANAGSVGSFLNTEIKGVYNHRYV